MSIEHFLEASTCGPSDLGLLHPQNEVMQLENHVMLDFDISVGRVDWVDFDNLAFGRVFSDHMFVMTKPMVRGSGVRSRVGP